MNPLQRRFVGWLLAAAVIVMPSAGAALLGAQSDDLPVRSADLAVRSIDNRIRSLIATATEQSDTFRRLSERVKESGGLVYVEPGRCGHGVRACLVKVTIAGNRRVFFVKVAPTKPDMELMASIGHELQHATELLDGGVNSTTGLFFFYQRSGSLGSSLGAFETQAAIETGNTIAAELRKQRRRAGSN